MGWLLQLMTYFVSIQYLMFRVTNMNVSWIWDIGKTQQYNQFRPELHTFRSTTNNLSSHTYPRKFRDQRSQRHNQLWMISELPCITIKCTFPPTLGRTFVLSYVSCRNWGVKVVCCVFFHSRNPTYVHVAIILYMLLMLLSWCYHATNMAQTQMCCMCRVKWISNSLKLIQLVLFENDLLIGTPTDFFTHTHDIKRRKTNSAKHWQCQTQTQKPGESTFKQSLVWNLIQCFVQFTHKTTHKITKSRKITKNHEKITRKITRAFLRSTPTKVQVRFFSERLISQWLFKSMFRGQILTRNPATNM